MVKNMNFIDPEKDESVNEGKSLDSILFWYMYKWYSKF